MTVCVVLVIAAAAMPAATDDRGIDTARAASAGPVRLGVDGRTNAFSSVAVSGATVAITWAATDASGVSDVYTAVSRDAGQSFAPPVRVNDIAGQARVNGEQPPRVELVGHAGAPPDVVVVWTAPGTGGTALLFARSADGGRTFTRAATVPGSNGPGNRGWLSTTQAGDRTLVAWLDHRETAAAAGGHAHGAGHAQTTAASPTGMAARRDPTVRAQASQIWIASLDGRLPPQPLARGVCYCCKTALTMDRGAVVAAWRHVYPGSQRDIALARSIDGGTRFSAPTRVSQDGWAIDGCPENGPAVAIDSAGRVHAVWPTLVRDAGAERLTVFHAVSRADGTFSPRQALPGGAAAFHPQVALIRNDRLAVVWEEPTPDGRRRVQLAWGRIAPDGTARFRATALADGDGALYPTVSRLTADRVLLTWTVRTGSVGAIAVLTAPAPSS